MKTIPLHEAILSGSTLIRWRAHTTLAYNLQGEPVGGCAIGMALVAADADAFLRAKSAIAAENWPWVLTTRFLLYPCECGNAHRGPLAGQIDVSTLVIIGHLFDHHVMNDFDYIYQRWSLERLCDWVRSVDPTLTLAAPTEAREAELVEA